MTRPQAPSRSGVAMVLLVALVSLLTACGDDPEPLVLRTDLPRAEIAPIVADFEEIATVPVEIRYDVTGSADVLLLQAGDLTRRSAEGTLTTLPEATLGQVPEIFTSSSGDWTGVTGRVRALAHDPGRIPAEELPDDVRALAAPEWADRVGFAPATPGFQAFVTALRAADGDAAARDFLTALVDGGARVVEDEAAVITALTEGAIEAGLVDHDAIDGATPRLELHFFAPGNVGSLVTATGVAIPTAAGDAERAGMLVDYLLSPETQGALVAATGDYGLVAGSPAPVGVPTLAELRGGADTGPEELTDAEGTRALLTELGLL